MSLYQIGDSQAWKWYDEFYLETGYSYIIREDGDFEVLYHGKPIARVESREAVDDVIAMHMGD